MSGHNEQDNGPTLPDTVYLGDHIYAHYDGTCIVLTIGEPGLEHGQLCLLPRTLKSLKAFEEDIDEFYKRD